MKYRSEIRNTKTHQKWTFEFEDLEKLIDFKKIMLLATVSPENLEARDSLLTPERPLQSSVRLANNDNCQKG